MSEAIPLTFEQQLQKFKSRGMVVEKNDVHALQHINYYRLKEFANPFARNVNGEIRYTGIKFSEVLNRYHQDENLRIYMLHAIEKIEVSVKTRISHILGKKYGAYGYLDFAKWSNREKYTKFEVEQKQFYIKKRLLQIVINTHSNKLSTKTNFDKDGFPTVWFGIDLLMFGDMVSILELMAESNIKVISSFYGCSNDELLSWLKCLNFIRNICAHNSNLLDIKITTKPKLQKSWSTYLFEMKLGQNQPPKPTNRLAVVLLIVIKLVNKIAPQYDWNHIQKSINYVCNRNEERAHLLGFRTLEETKSIFEDNL